MNYKKLYQDPKFPASFTGKIRFYNAVKSKEKKTRLTIIEDVLKSVDSYTLHKPVTKPPLFRRIYTSDINFLY